MTSVGRSRNFIADILALLPLRMSILECKARSHEYPPTGRRVDSIIVTGSQVLLFVRETIRLAWSCLNILLRSVFSAILAVPTNLTHIDGCGPEKRRAGDKRLQ